LDVSLFKEMAESQFYAVCLPPDFDVTGAEQG